VTERTKTYHYQQNEHASSGGERQIKLLAAVVALSISEYHVNEVQ